MPNRPSASANCRPSGACCRKNSRASASSPPISTPAPEGAPERKKPPSPQITTAGVTILLCSAAMTIMSGAIIAPALPGIADHFHADPERDVRIKLLLTLPALVIALTAPLAGWIIDRAGRRPVLIAGFVSFALSGSLGLFLDQLDLLLASRVVLGAAVAALATVINTLISDLFTGEKRSGLIGRQSVFMSGGSIVFLVLGGLLASLHWRAPFAVYFAAIPMMALALRFIPEPPCPHRPSGENESSVLSLLARPAIPVIIITGMAGMVAFYQIPVQMPFFLREEFDATPVQSGIAIALATVFSAGLATQFSRGLRRLGHTLVMALAFCAMGAALGGLSLARHPALVALSLALLGCGLGWLMPNLTAWMGHAAPPAVRGRAMGLLGSSIFLGQFLAPVAASPVLAAGGGFRELFAIMGVSATLVGMVYLAATLSIFLRSGRPKTAGQP